MRDIFSWVDLTHLNAPIGPTFISGTHIIKLYYEYLLQTVKIIGFSIGDLLAKLKLSRQSKNFMMIPKKLLNVKKYLTLGSYRIIQPNGQSYITK